MRKLSVYAETIYGRYHLTLSLTDALTLRHRTCWHSSAL